MTNRTRVSCWCCPVCGHRVVGPRTAVEHVTVVHRRICRSRPRRRVRASVS